MLGDCECKMRLYFLRVCLRLDDEMKRVIFFCFLASEMDVIDDRIV